MKLIIAVTAVVPYWYSNPATLDLAIAKQPQSAGVAPAPTPLTANEQQPSRSRSVGSAVLFRDHRRAYSFGDLMPGR
jgi:hypothetical protein